MFGSSCVSLCRVRLHTVLANFGFSKIKIPDSTRWLTLRGVRLCTVLANFDLRTLFKIISKIQHMDPRFPGKGGFQKLFWERFNLSLPGRLTIMKTSLISQLNYVGCFLPALAEVLISI